MKFFIKKIKKMSKKSYISSLPSSVTLPQLQYEILKYNDVIRLFTYYSVNCIVSYLAKHLKDTKLEFWTDYECPELLERISECDNITIYYSDIFNIPCLKVGNNRIKFITDKGYDIEVIPSRVQFLEYRKFTCLSFECIVPLQRYLSNFEGRLLLEGPTWLEQLFPNGKLSNGLNIEDCDILISIGNLARNMYYGKCKRAFFITDFPEFEKFILCER